MIKDADLKNQLHAFMAGDKAQPAIKSVGVGARFIGRQLRRSAPPLPRQVKGIFHQGLTDATAAAGRADPNRFDLGPPSAFVTKAGNEGQLQAGNDCAGVLSDDQILARIGRDGGKGIVIGLRQRITQIFSGGAQFIVGQKSNNSWKISNKCSAKSDGLGHGDIAGPLRNMGQLLLLYKPKAKICPEKVSYAYP